MSESPAYGAKVRIDGHAAEVLAAAQALRISEPAISAGATHFRKINHNRLELARVSAGVTSCDVGDRRGCVNVFAVVIIPPPWRPYGACRRWQNPSWRARSR